MDREKLVAAVDEEIGRLALARNLLIIGARDAVVAKRGRSRGKRHLSPEARQRIADAQKKRWAAAKRDAK
jgi:hypothetical protein